MKRRDQSLIGPRGVIIALFAIFSANLAHGALAGDLDVTFAGTGQAFTSIGQKASAQDVALLSDGRLLAGGFAQFLEPGAADTDFALVRYLAEGGLDGTFGVGGVVTTHLGGGFEIVTGVLVDRDTEQTLAVGFTRHASLDFDVAVVRYDASGALDPSFGSGGTVITDFDGPGVGNDRANAVTFLPGGAIAVAGSSEARFLLATYQSDGTLALTVTTDVGGGGANAIARQPDGKIVLAGVGSGGFALVRYDSDGTPDGTFGAGGRVDTGFGTGFANASSVLVQPDGKLVAAGSTNSLGSPTGIDVALARYLPDGTLDPLFGVGGTVITPFSSGTDVASDLTLQFDGKLVVAGESDGVRLLARYDADGALDPSFLGAGSVTIGLGVNAAVLLDRVGRIVTAGSAGDEIVLARHLSEPTECGNGDPEFGEECDDGNTVDGDCCSAACRTEPDGSPCALDASACTTDACRKGLCVHEVAVDAGCAGASPRGASITLKDDEEDTRDLLKWEVEERRADRGRPHGRPDGRHRPLAVCPRGARRGASPDARERDPARGNLRQRAVLDGDRQRLHLQEPRPDTGRHRAREPLCTRPQGGEGQCDRQGAAAAARRHARHPGHRAARPQRRPGVLRGDVLQGDAAGRVPAEGALELRAGRGAPGPRSGRPARA